MQLVVITWYRAPLFHLLQDPMGDVGRHMFNRGLRIQQSARAVVGKDTGALAASIGISQKPTRMGQEMTIGSPLRHAYMHHEGTRPHIITPKGGNTHLRFSSRGRIVYTRAVMHPGTRPNRYLSRFLYMVR